MSTAEQLLRVTSSPYQSHTHTLTSANRISGTLTQLLRDPPLAFFSFPFLSSPFLLLPPMFLPLLLHNCLPPHSDDTVHRYDPALPRKCRPRYSEAGDTVLRDCLSRSFQARVSRSIVARCGRLALRNDTEDEVDLVTAAMLPHRCGSGSDLRQWEKAVRGKTIVLNAWRTGKTGSKVAAIKAVQKIIQTQTRGSADPRVSGAPATEHARAGEGACDLTSLPT